MINYGNLTVSKYARVLCLNNQCVIGNIATDGRWIKIPRNTWDHIISILNSSDFDGLSDENIAKAIKVLHEIHVLVDESESVDDLPIHIKPYDVTIELTTQCNLRCKHCSYSFGGQKYNEISYENIIALARWCSRNNVKRILITGGEPFCRKDIWKVIKDIRDFYKGSLEIITNGTLIDKSDVFNIIKYIDRLHISLDGYDEKSVAAIRGCNVFERVVTVIKELQANQFKNISLSCVDTGDQKKIERFNDLTNKLKVKSVVRKLNLKGQANKNFRYENSDTHQLISEKGTSMKSICNHIYSSLFVNTYGKVFSCAALREMEYNIGIFSAEKGEFELNIDSMIPIVDTIDECSTCNVRYFCATPCISQNDVIYLSKEYRKQRCESLHDILFSIVWE